MEEINLYDLVKFYAKNWLGILVAILIGASVGAAYTYLVQKPLYQSDATLLAVGTQRVSSGQESVVLNNYVELFKSQRVLDPVIREHDYAGGYSELSQNVTAQNSKNTDIITVSIASPDANVSKALLEGAIESFRTEVKELYGDNNISIKTVDEATLATMPSNVNPTAQIGLGAAAGAVLIIVVMFFYYDYRHSAASRQQEQPAPVEEKAKQPVKLAKSKSRKPKQSEPAASEAVVKPLAEIPVDTTPVVEKVISAAPPRQRGTLATGVRRLLVGDTTDDRGER